MDVTKIQYFLAVAEHKSISRAAEMLRVAQPTLSRHMQSLGREFGVPLITRNGRGISITDAGQRLQEGLRGLDRQLRVLREEVGAAGGQATGEVAFGLPPSPRTLLGVSVVKSFSRVHPKVTVRVAEDTSARLCDLVVRGDLDLAVTNSFEPIDDLHVEMLATEPLLLVGPPGDGLSMRKVTTVPSLGDLPMIVTTPPNSLWIILEGALRRHGLRPRVRIEANTLPLMIDLVREGLGYTMLPSCGVFPFLKSNLVTASPIAGLQVTWVIAYPNNRPLSEAARMFARTVVEEAHRLVENGEWVLAKSRVLPKKRHQKPR